MTHVCLSLPVLPGARSGGGDSRAQESRSCERHRVCVLGGGGGECVCVCNEWH